MQNDKTILKLDIKVWGFSKENKKIKQVPLTVHFWWMDSSYEEGSEESRSGLGILKNTQQQGEVGEMACGSWKVILRKLKNMSIKVVNIEIKGGINI